MSNENLSMDDVAKLKASLPDIQKTQDERGINIDRVGVENIDFPMLIEMKKGGAIQIHTRVDMYTSLDHVRKGIHMSRFAEILMSHRYTVLNQASLRSILNELQVRMDNVKDAYIIVSFKYFLPRTAPVSKIESTMAYDCRFIGKLENGKFTFRFEVTVITTSCCPCSKEISIDVGGAHNQRSVVTVKVEPAVEKELWIEDLVPLVEEAGSCPVYPLLKRVDEKYVTEKAYENPKFVEDISRDIAVILESLPINFYKIRVSNQESIHMHDAVAYIARNKVNGEWVEI